MRYLMASFMDNGYTVGTGTGMGRGTGDQLQEAVGCNDPALMIHD